jgi:hypothetical protein
MGMSILWDRYPSMWICFFVESGVGDIPWWSMMMDSYSILKKSYIRGRRRNIQNVTQNKK